MRPKNKFESQGESIQDSCKTSNDVRCRDLGSEESTREEAGYMAEMIILRWMDGVTKLDRISNERIRGTAKVGEISKKVQESRLNYWYGHVLRREEEFVGKRVMVMEVPGKRRRGRLNRRWSDSRNDMSERELSGEEGQDWIKWRRLIRNIDLT